MNEPPDKDRGDAGRLLPGLNLPVGSSITIISNDDLSKMDTDGSVSSKTGDTRETGRKRTRYIRICRECSKRRKKKVSGQLMTGDFCQCDNISNINDNTLIMKKVTPVLDESHSANHLQTETNDNSPKIQLINDQNNSQKESRQVGRSEYLSSDAAPYLIHVQRIENSPNDGTILHPIAFGNFLRKNNFQNIISGSVKRIGRNRCAVAFSKFSDANDFLHSKLLDVNKFKAFIPTFNVTRMGLVRGVPTDWDEEEIKENVSTPIGCGNIIKVRRLNYKVNVDGTTKWKPSQSIVVTFDGQVLPKRIFMCYNALPVEVYVYPTIQCFRCCKYGHTKLQCRSKFPKCFKCGEDHLGDTCNREEDSASCVSCGGFHYATNKLCPEFLRQKEIKHTMAHSCISYIEASKLFPAVSKSYANILNSNPGQPNKSTQDNISNHSSYKKTVFLKPRSPPKTQGGYDRAAHNAIVKELEFPAPKNGCALSTNPTKSDDSDLNTILALINTLLQSNLLKPSHVAPINALFNILCNNGFQNNTMELQKHNTEKN